MLVNPLYVVHVAIGSIIALLAIPLIFRMVPMNHLYGVRIPKAFASPKNWYDINAYGGKLLLVYGVLLIVFGIAARSHAPDPRSIWALPFVIVPLLLAIPMLALIFAYARRLP